MTSSARLKGAGLLALAAALACGRAQADDPPLADQLLGLGRQALAQDQKALARSFLTKAVELDPKNAEAKRLLSDERLVRVAMQDPAVPPAPAPGGNADAPQTPATLEQQAQMQQLETQVLVDDIRQRQAEARRLLNQANPEAAINLLRLGVRAVENNNRVPESVRNQLTRELNTDIQSAVSREERLQAEQAELYRIQSMATQRTRDVAEREQVQLTVDVLMDQFDALMAKGVYNVLFNGGTGDIAVATAPFFDARIVAQHARALDPYAVAPWAGTSKSQYEGFLAQALQFEALKEYRAMLSWQDVDRAAVPFPDTLTIEYPDAEHWRRISETRIRRYESSSLEERDAKTQAIIDTLDTPVAMPFQQETSLADVVKYIQAATVKPPELPSGIPIYVDPAGLLEAEKTLESTVTLNLEGVSLKRSLRLLLKQLDLNYTVKDGLMTITYVASADQPTEIRVYPVADLALIPLSLMFGGGGGGMGGMGGGMGGMGGGMGGMGGGMGGMGGGMGGMGGGGMGGMGGMGGGGGFRSMPLEPLQQPGDAGAFMQKKSN